MILRAKILDAAMISKPKNYNPKQAILKAGGDACPTFPPTIGVCGRSGSGKTFLIQHLVPCLTRRGLRVAVVKHCTHRLEADKPGKDTDRIFQAGADVLAAGPQESFARYHETSMPLLHALPRVAAGCDVCLVEGFRDEGLPRIQVLFEADPEPRSDDANLIFTIRGLGDKLAACPTMAGENGCSLAEVAEVERVVFDFLGRAHAALPAMALLLVGGQSRRMGRPKSLLEVKGTTVLERLVAAVEPHAGRILLSGAGPVPDALVRLDRLPDIPGAQGPLAGILSAMRWHPGARWIILACDLPLVEPAAVQWLLTHRHPGLDAICPCLTEDSTGEPLFAIYEPCCRSRLEHAMLKAQWSLRRTLVGDRVLKPVVPQALRHAWTNANTPEEWERARRFVQ